MLHSAPMTAIALPSRRLKFLPDFEIQSAETITDWYSFDCDPFIQGGLDWQNDNRFPVAILLYCRNISAVRRQNLRMPHSAVEPGEFGPLAGTQGAQGEMRYALHIRAPAP